MALKCLYSSSDRQDQQYHTNRVTETARTHTAVHSRTQTDTEVHVSLGTLLCARAPQRSPCRRCWCYCFCHRRRSEAAADVISVDGRGSYSTVGYEQNCISEYVFMLLSSLLVRVRYLNCEAKTKLIHMAVSFVLSHYYVLLNLNSNRLLVCLSILA